MKPTLFILVDDDPLNNYISKKFIRHVLPQVEVIDFILPEKGFNYVATEFSSGYKTPSILLLDINMPVMSGWDFLEKYDLLDQKIKDQVTIYILSSSVDQQDKDRASANKYIKGYLEKPLQATVIKKLYEDHVLISSLLTKDVK